jgi:hypothetical protein
VCASTASRSVVYTTNIAMPVANIATVVIATTVHPERELGWPCISLPSEATTRIATRRKGANNPLMTAAVPSQGLLPESRLHPTSSVIVRVHSADKQQINFTARIEIHPRRI